MEAADSSSWTLLETAEAAKVLLSEERRFLEPFMEHERSVGEVARELGVAVDALAYRTRRFVQLGLLRQTREEPRKGRAIKYYRAPPGYRAPIALLPVADLEELVRTLDAPMRELALKDFARLLEGAGFASWSVHCYRDELGRMRLELVPPVEGWRSEDVMHPDVPALLFNWVPLQLDPERAKELQAELVQLLGRYQGPTDAPTHLLGLFLVPHRGDK